MLLLPATPEVIASFVAEAEAAPEELSTVANVMVAPPLPFVPPEYHGRFVVMAMLVHAGELDAGERAVAPFRALAAPIADMVRPMPCPAIYRDAAETIVEYLQASDASMRVAQLRVLGGAMARVPGVLIGPAPTAARATIPPPRPPSGDAAQRLGSYRCPCRFAVRRPTRVRPEGAR